MQGAVIVGAVGNQGGEAVGPVIGPDQVVARGLGGRVRAVGGIRGGFRKRRVLRIKRAVDLIGGDVEKPELVMLCGRQALEIAPALLQEG